MKPEHAPPTEPWSVRVFHGLMALVVCGVGIPPATFAAVVATNASATSLTADRVARQPAWQAYLEASARQRKADQDFLRAELKAHGLRRSTEPRQSRNALVRHLNKPAAWYATPEARRMAYAIVSFQTPAGGWCKNTDFTKRRRAPGEMFGAEAGSMVLRAGDSDESRNPEWSYIGTFDNGATTSELRFLAKVIAASKDSPGQWERSFQRGLDYIFAAQFPHGGWPQVWPLQGGYHDAVTFNDNAMLHLLELLREVASGQGDFAFVSAGYRERAKAGWKRGVECVLAAQIVAAGRRTVWCQQHDAVTLAPTSARNYEMAAQVSAESAGIVLFLMQLPQPDPNIVSAVHAACAWFEQTRIVDGHIAGGSRNDWKSGSDAGAAPVWSRFYEIGTDRPIFGDRDKSIHDNVNDLSQERRHGYSWFCDTPSQVLQHYAEWARQHPQP